MDEQMNNNGYQSQPNPMQIRIRTIMQLLFWFLV